MKTIFSFMPGLVACFVWAAVASAGPIHDAAKAGDVEALRSLIESGVSVESESPLGTPLAVAARAGHADAVELLLGHKANVEAESVLGRPLMLAVARDHIGIVKLLLEAGADPNKGKRSLPLATAARRGHAEIIRRLLSFGADTETAPDSDRILAIHEAAENGHAEAVRILLAAGADPNALTASHHTALHLATLHEYPEIADLLREITDVKLPIQIDEAQLAKADLQKGAEHTKYYCSICHPVGNQMGAEEAIGPQLWALEGRRRGTIDENFPYSQALRADDGSWDIHSLNEFLYAPAVVVPGTSMGLLPLTDATIRIQIIAYLRTIGSQ